LKTVYTVCIIVFLLRALPAFGATDSERTVQVLSSDPAEVRNWKPSFATLNDWVEKMTRPGFRVLYKANVKGHYVAVFRTEDNRLAILNYPGQLHRTGLNLLVTTPQGVDLVDESALSVLSALYHVVLLHPPDTARNPQKEVVSLTYQQTDGRVVRLKNGYTGPIHVVLRVWYQEDPESKRILDWRYDWK